MDDGAPAPPYADAAPARITDDEFERMLVAGAFGGMGKVELRGGAIVKMRAENAPHLRAKSRIATRMIDGIRASGLEIEALIDGTVRFGDGFAPEPDIVVATLEPAEKALPGAFALLCVEIADTTLADDLGAKRDAYARAGLPEYWVVDLAARCIHQFAAPRDGAYARAGVVQLGETAESLTLSGLSVSTQGLT